MNPEEIKLLIPFEAVDPDRTLIQSVEEKGILSPLVAVEGRVVDGIRRMKAASQIGLKDLPLREVSGDPYETRWHLNLSRPWNLVETAFLYDELAPEKRSLFLKDLSIGESPAIPHIMEFLKESKKHYQPLREGKITLAILRDLTFDERGLQPWVEWLLMARGSMGEKRVAASLVRACSLRGAVPPLPETEKVSEIIRILKPLAHPVTSTHSNLFQEGLKRRNLPRGVRVTMDETLEREGVEVTVRVKRGDLEVVDRVKEEIEVLFEELDFL